MIESPSRESISTALKRLEDAGALDPESNLTPLGHHLAALPVDIRIGKLILFGAIFCCLDSALTIAAFLSHKSPFISSFYKSSEVFEKKKKYLTANSDQITTLNVYKVIFKQDQTKILRVKYYMIQPTLIFNFLEMVRYVINPWV